MSVSIQELRPHLQAFDLPHLFVEGLGWNHYRAEPLAVLVDGCEYSLKAVAEKAGFQVFECSPGQDGVIPPYPVRRKIESQAAKSAFEHVIIFVDQEKTVQIWQWVKRENGKPAACREQTFYSGQTGDALLQRLGEIAFTLDEEAGLNIPRVVSKVSKALDVDKLTRRFYDRFRSELTAFAGFIEGITAQGDRDWYASLMLNRMMFVYFVQKQGFLNEDRDYLRNKLREVQSKHGDGRFQDFYRQFLLKLFHEGLGKPEPRARDLVALLGRIPFLNGGLFDVHDLEHDNPDIGIPDKAFEKVFDFFDEYRWHLDERQYREDNEINPDVLGYIFEKYVNQKQMGAYYTKEDITGYISRNTVIPFLFDAARKECPVAFGPDGGVWRLLQDAPDDYIYPPVGHGITWNARQAENPIRLSVPVELPDEIVVGINDISKRGSWNRPAPDDFALPTETWREVVARRQRYAEVRAKLASGEVKEIDELITLNLNVEKFAKDIIAHSEGPELLRAFWHALRDVSILDPTCGSGAFLFAALNDLEPLYTACLEGMQGFLGDLERTERPHHPDALHDFRDIREQLHRHPNERYFILKTIVLNNLYGVDIMGEAVEICKLRLFLKLVAQLKSYDQIEPLPDIDFNVRAGNTLVGFTSLDAMRQAMTITSDGQRRALFDGDRATLARIEKEAAIANAAFDQFRRHQTTLDGQVTVDEKADLRRRLKNLGSELDRLLATEYRINPDKSAAYEAWRGSHQPFHWFVEFHGIMRKGGFDVVIGNPPYVELPKVSAQYTVKTSEVISTGNLYAVCIERFLNLLHEGRRYGVIIPVSSVSTPRMLPLMRLLVGRSTIHGSNFAVRPAKLFDGVDMNLSILIGATNTKDGPRQIFSTAYNRWNKALRDHLFQIMSYTRSSFEAPTSAIPKIGSVTERAILSRLSSLPLLRRFRVKRTSSPIYCHSGGRYFRKCIKHKLSNEYKEVALTAEAANPILCLLSSSLYYWFWIVLSDCYHVTRGDIDVLPVPDSMIADIRFDKLADSLMDDLEEHAIVRLRKRADGSEQKEKNYVVAESKALIDKIDQALAQHYGFTEAELDFIINYDIKYRMGREG